MAGDRTEVLLTTIEVAAFLNVNPKQVYRLLRRGLPGRRIGGEWRFLQAEVMAWSAGAAGAAAGDSAGAASPDPMAPAGTPTPAVTSTPPLLAANGDVVIEELLALLNAGGPPLFGFVQSDRGGAAARLADGSVLAAGSHGGPPPAHLGRVRLARIHLVDREVGIAAPPGRPVPRLPQLARLRFASRPPTAGIVAHLAAALQEAGIDLRRIADRASALDSHREVVFSILRGEADAGLTTHAWAHRVGLAFRPLAIEGYGLLVRAADLGEARVVRLCEVAQGPALRRRLTAIAGYDPTGAGDIRYDPVALLETTR